MKILVDEMHKNRHEFSDEFGRLEIIAVNIFYPRLAA